MPQSLPLTSRFRRLVTVVLALLAFGTFSPSAFAIAVTEPPDFPNAAPGTNYVLGAGVHTFSGTLNISSDTQDYFNVTVPAGLFITQVSKTATIISGYVRFNGETLSDSGTATFSGTGATPYPLPAGTYQALANVDGFSGSWSITMTVGPAPDYVVSIGSGSISITDLSGNSDALSLSPSGTGNIRFAAAGRTFSINGGALSTGDSGDISLSGITSITVDGGAGSNTLNIGAFPGVSFPYLIIKGGPGNDTINFNGDMTFESGQSLEVSNQIDGKTPEVETVNVAAGANIVASGSGSLRVRCSRNISLDPGASLEMENGTLDIEANH